MDTPDRATGLADSQLADAINRNWLEESAQSCQLSNELKRRHLETALTSSSAQANLYGATGAGWLGERAAGPTSQRRRRNSLEAGNLNSTYTMASGHPLYDNISFADAPALGPAAFGSRRQAPPAGSGADEKLARASWRCLHKFRLLLACYVLLGVTLAIYSRNALSLAAVGMVAGNQANRELVGAASRPDGGQLSRSPPVDKQIYAAPDGSCPVYYTPAQRSAGLRNSSHAGGQRAQLAHADSIRKRVERGELVDWTPGQQGLIFAAGSLGNLLLAIPLTRLGEVYGPKWIIFAASLGASLQAALMPLVAPRHVALVILFQVVFNGLTFGADCVAYTLFAHWLTPDEMAFFVSCLLVCYQMGSILSSFVTARILANGLAWSWCFYAPAMLCAAWTLVWAFIGASRPSDSVLVSKRELLFLLNNSKISASLAAAGRQSKGKSSPTGHQHNPAPAASVSWPKLARDPNIWAIVAVKFALRWYFSVYVSLMPTYLSSVAHMSVETIGQISVVQSLVGLLTGLLMGYLTKSLVTSRPFNLSLASTRKLFQSIVNFGLALSLAVFVAYDCEQWVTIIALTLAGICINFYCAAALQLPLDLSPTHCGLITSISNTLALGQTLGAPVSGLILNSGPRERALWRIVWLLAIVLNTLSGLVFILLVDTKQRDYSKPGPPAGRTGNSNCD